MKFLTIFVVFLLLFGCVSTQSNKDWAHRTVYKPNNENLEDEKVRLTSEIEQEKVNRNIHKESSGFGDTILQTLVAVNSAMQQTNQVLAQQNEIKARELVKVQKQANQSSKKVTRTPNNSVIAKSVPSPTQPISPSKVESAKEERATRVVLGTPNYQIVKTKISSKENNEQKACDSISKVDGILCKIEKIALCKQNDAGFWFCYGHNQYTNSGEQGDSGLRNNLRYAGCASPRHRVNIARDIFLFYCSEPWKKGWENQPVSAMEKQFSTTIPQNLKSDRRLFRCNSLNDIKCEIVQL